MSTTVTSSPLQVTGSSAAETIKSISEAAGVTCPKETGEMATDADCLGCPHFGECMKALMEELGEPYG